MDTLTLLFKALIITALLFSSYSHGQQFVKVTDPSNPTSTAIVSTGNYAGASWMDYEVTEDLIFFGIKIQTSSKVIPVIYLRYCQIL
jgi:hypothetical protein